MPTPTPGLLWVTSNPTKTTHSAFNKWYNSEHIPDVVSTSGMKTAFRYENIDPSSERKYLALYPVRDLDFLSSQEFKDIPTESALFEEGQKKKCFEVADFHMRFYEWVDGFQAEGKGNGPANLVISAALSPAPGTDDDFDRWYKDEHYRTLSECKGFVRTRRYKLNNAHGKEGVPTYLALHEFEGEQLPQEDLDKSGSTEWAKKVMGGLVGIEVFVFKLLEGFGDVKAKF